MILRERVRAMGVLVMAWGVALAGFWVAAPSTASPPDPVARGIDHVALAVRDLERASETFRRLGFVLKPGRPHANGIRNRHVKFADGTEIELITASDARDPLTAAYVRHLRSGDGPAFLGLFAPDASALERALTTAGFDHRRAGALHVLPDTSVLGYTFFGRRNRAPTDRPAHFSHPNGSDGLLAVWIADRDLAAERALLETLGALFSERIWPLAKNLRVPVAEMPGSEIALLPGSHQRVPGRRIVGLTVRTRGLDRVRAALRAGGISAVETIETSAGRSLLVPPDVAHGTWLEFREVRPTEESRPARAPG